MKQLALLIGNNAYQEETLKNAVNDAKSLGAKLHELGFDCRVATDAGVRDMDAALSEFGTALANNEVGLFFFAGHGMQIDGLNYLAATDTNFESERDAKYSSLPLNKVIETMESGGNRTSILILDACRTNPYERRWRSGGPRGLAPVYAPKGMIIAYATSPGQVAYDGAGANGAYTSALLAHISHQNLTIESCLKRVRNTLSSSTSGKQISWEHTSLMGEYHFNLSIASQVGVAGYSSSALADKDYGPLRGKAGEIIEGLKSSNWHRQNPAVAKLNSEVLQHATKDACFVLGRNIYQAACGTANAAVAFIKDLRNSIRPFQGSIGFHVLNGMLFEIYFDSRGLFREVPKASYQDEVFALEEDSDYKDSFGFICAQLEPHRGRLFYFPRTTTDVSFDVVLKRFNDHPTVARIDHAGDNVLYNSEGDGYFTLDDDVSLEKDTAASFRSKIAISTGTPTFRLKLSFVGRYAEIEEFRAPRRPNIQKMASK